ncbi:MAG: S8 family serine peptidase [Opitutales bacterium]
MIQKPRRLDHPQKRTLTSLQQGRATFSSAAALLFSASSLLGQPDIERAESTLIPKRETGVLEFLEKHPTYDGRGVVIAVFDTGVDPAAHGLQTTTTGERKLVDIIDGSGAGDVDMSHTINLAEVDEEKPLKGLTGRKLTLPEELQGTERTIHIGMKRAKELFHPAPWGRIMEARKKAWQLKNNQERAERKASETEEERAWEKKHPSDRTLDEQDQAARVSLLEGLEKSFLKDDPGPVYDCILWSAGDIFKVIIDTDEDGDLGDEEILRPFGIEGEYARFADPVSATFGVQVYDSGKLLSIVTVSGSHGTHVAAIAAAHFPEDPKRNGIAPGARILSVRLGDVRAGGSSNYFGEMRAVASAARNKVDIMNASWGGASTYQDGSALSARLYNKLVRDYGVTAFVSAGNNGPALSTLGSPGGEAEHVIGVGAYVSPEMGKYLYALSEENPETGYGFTSRGPGKSGDLGVDIFAPGGATASLASDSLRGSQLYNGTSMAAPSAAGVGALLISAAKQLELDHSPERIKAALMNTAIATGEEPFTEGAGLIQSLPALEFLKSQAKEFAWDIHYNLEGPAGTFRSGPGLYLRENLRDSKIDIPITITPEFSEFTDDTTAYNWEANVALSTTEPWLKSPEYTRLANGRQRLTLTVDAEKLPEAGTPAFAKLIGKLADDSEGNTLFQFPVTIVEPQEMSHPETYEHKETISLTSSNTRRIFLKAPDRADHLKLSVKLPDDQTDVRRRFVINVLSLADDASFREKNLTEYLWFTPGEEKTLLAEVHGGQVVEITVHQYWSTPGAYTLELESEFIGVGASSDELAIAKNYDFSTLRLHPLQDLEGKISANLDTAFISKYAEKMERFPGDERMHFPPAPRQEDAFTPFRLRHSFSFELEEDATIEIASSRPFDIFQDFGGDLYTVYDAQGDLAFVGSLWRMKPTALTKGKISVTRDIIAYDESLLKAAEDRPLLIKMESKIGGLAVYPNTPKASRGGTAKTISLPADTHQTFYLKNTQAEAISKLKNKPDFVTGTFEVKSKEDETIAKIPIWLQPGDVFSEVVNPEPKPKQGDKDEDPLEDLDDKLYGQKKGFIEAQLKAVEKDLAAKRDSLLESLIETHSDKAELYLIGAKINAIHAYLVPEFMGRPAPHKEEPKDDEASDSSNEASADEEASEDTEKPDEAPEPEPNLEAKEAILTDLAKARELSDPDSVAQFLGAQPAAFPGDTETRSENKEEADEMKEAQKLIANTWRLEAAIALVTQDEEAFKNAYVELKRWEKEPSEDTIQLMGDYYKEQELLGLSLKELNAALKENPGDTDAFQKRIDLYRDLGWDTFADRDALKLKLRKSAPLNLL